jgi:hypothetical protein
MPRPPNPNITRAVRLAAQGYSQYALEAALTAAKEEAGACLYVRHEDAVALLVALQAAVEQLECVALLVADGLYQAAGPSTSDGAGGADDR